MSDSSRVNVRLGPELLARIEKFRVESGMETTSAAARALIDLGLQQGNQLDAAWRRITWREGTVAAGRAFKAAYATAVDETLKVGGAE